MTFRRVIVQAALALLPVLAARAEWPRNVEVHGFVSQGFALSNDNNYLTMRTSQGTGRMTDGGLNATWRINDRLRVGAQVYDRYIGELGKGRVSLDWATVDFRLRDWLGIRAGRVKTPMGLFNDVQDQEFLHTWALLPQSTYPLDLREMTIAHNGVDLYGSVGLKRGGFLAYQVYAGKVPMDSRSGLVYGLEDGGYSKVEMKMRTTGGDLRWTTPVPGLTAGYSYAHGQTSYNGNVAQLGGTRAGVDVYLRRTQVGYVDFARGRWRLNGEYRAERLLTDVGFVPPPYNRNSGKLTDWFASAAYRLSPLVEVGAYRSQHLYQSPIIEAYSNGQGNHIYDTVVALRIDPKPYWNIKVEGHFIDGVGSAFSIRGFYQRYHPSGMAAQTNLLVLRTELNF